MVSVGLNVFLSKNSNNKERKDNRAGEATLEWPLLGLDLMRLFEKNIAFLHFDLAIVPPQCT